jgi:hypothetical protein
MASFANKISNTKDSFLKNFSTSFFSDPGFSAYSLPACFIFAGHKQAETY